MSRLHRANRRERSSDVRDAVPVRGLCQFKSSDRNPTMRYSLDPSSPSTARYTRYKACGQSTLRRRLFPRPTGRGPIEARRRRRAPVCFQGQTGPPRLAACLTQYGLVSSASSAASMRGMATGPVSRVLHAVDYRRGLHARTSQKLLQRATHEAEDGGRTLGARRSHRSGDPATSRWGPERAHQNPVSGTETAARAG